jgi:hypothetical protein
MEHQSFHGNKSLLNEFNDMRSLVDNFHTEKDKEELRLQNHLNTQNNIDA